MLADVLDLNLSIMHRKGLLAFVGLSFIIELARAICNPDGERDPAGLKWALTVFSKVDCFPSEVPAGMSKRITNLGGGIVGDDLQNMIEDFENNCWSLLSIPVRAYKCSGLL